MSFSVAPRLFELEALSYRHFCEVDNAPGALLLTPPDATPSVTPRTPKTFTHALLCMELDEPLRGQLP